MRKTALAMLLLTGSLVSTALPALRADAAEKRSAPVNVLDFEADVIEGEKKKPDLFIQTGGADVTLDAILYSREHFNDFHERDSRWRPRVFKMKGRKKEVRQ